MGKLYLAKFVEWMQAQNWSKRTIESYSANVRFFYDFLSAETSVTALQEVDSKLLHGYQQYLYNQKLTSGKRLSLSTQHTRLVAVRSFFGYLHTTGVLLLDPSTDLVLPKKPKHLPKGVMSEQQVEKLLEQPDVSTSLGFRDRTLLEVLYATGLRNTELRNLALYDLDLPNLRLTVRQGKNAKDRVLPLGEIAADYLKEYLQTARLELNKNPEQQLLFVSKHGKQITQANLVWITRKYVKQAGLVGFTPHSLRHSCATHMLRGGADLRYVQEMLGHASVETTQIYTQVEVKDLQAMHRKYHPRERFDGGSTDDS